MSSPRFFTSVLSLKKGESPQRITSTRERAQALVAGHSVAEFDRIAEVAWRRSIAPKVFPNVLKQLRHHQELGHQVWLLTASPQGLASVMARDLRLSGAFGTTLMEHDGRFTGEINGELLHGPLKEQQALAFAASVGANLKDCYAYSDSIADIPLLTVVGHPVAVNPDASLLKHATHHSWPILWPEGSKRHQASRSKKGREKRWSRLVRPAHPLNELLLVATLVTSFTKQLTMLLLRHTLAALFNNRAPLSFLIKLGE